MAQRKVTFYNVGLWPFQREIYDDTTQHRVIVAGRRVGKSYVASTIAYHHLIDNRGGKVLIVAKNHASAVNTFWTPFLFGEPAADVQPIISETMIAHIHKQDRRITLINGGVIHLSGAENANSLRGMSPSPSMIICDEFDFFAPEVFYQVLQPMMADRKDAPYVIMGTPDVSRGQLYDAYVRGQSNDYPTWKSWQLTCLQARPDYADRIALARDVLSPDQFEREYNASFDTASDNVFRDFSINSSTGNVMFDLQPFAHGETVNIAIDFNVRIMAAAAFAVRKGPHGDQIEFLREWQGSANTDALVKRILAEFDGEKIVVFPDPSGNSRKTSAAIGQTDFSILREAGFTVKAHSAAPGIIDSVNCVNAMILNAAGKRRLFVHGRCKELIRSMLSTRWVDKPEAADRPRIDKTQDREHFSDGVRYACEYLFPIRSGKVVIAKTFNF